MTEPTNEPTNKATNNLTNEPAKKVANGFMDEPANKATNGFTDEPTNKATNNLTNEPAKKVANGFTDEPANKAANGFTTDEPANKATNGFTNEPANRVVNKATSGPADEIPASESHSRLLLDSYRRATGRDLLVPVPAPGEAAAALFRAPFVLLSHGTEADPVLNYGNAAALDLWETTWEKFTRTPSRLTAEPMERSQREKLLADAKEKGYSDGYYGIRISSGGRRFEIRNVLLWSVTDEQGSYRGQAAVFSEWAYV